jgi:hypothetical protein
MPSGWVELPHWLAASANAVFADVQGDDPIPDLCLLAKETDHPDAVVLGVFEPDGTGGGRSVSRLAGPVEMMLEIAEILQDESAERSGGWGQARPSCPYHPHPARPAAWGGEAWWVCERRDERLYRIGSGEVLAAAAATGRRRQRRNRSRWP